MKRNLLVTAFLLSLSFLLIAKTVVLNGTVTVKNIDQCKNGLDTIPANDSVLITAINATSKISERLGSPNKDGLFSISIDSKKYEYIIFSIFDTEIKQTFTVKELIKKEKILC